MSTIQIIRATPGPKTTQKILEVIQNYPDGITIRELHRTLNRPVSMLKVCLKPLLASGQVYTRLSQNRQHLIYCPSYQQEYQVKSQRLAELCLT